jgi:NAD(P)-dependent dehydrogenase (short-subunit alcohol dehydrogenase family)
MTGKVAVITGASEGIGAGLVAGYRGRGWTVVASARTIEPSPDPDVMARRYGGHVVNVPAAPAVTADSSAPAVLAALAKGALAAATRSLAIEYASFGIRVNAVSPGIIATPMRPPDSYEHLGGRLPPLGRAGRVSDVVDGVLFLESSPYVTGEILHIDGGQAAGR